MLSSADAQGKQAAECAPRLPSLPAPTAFAPGPAEAQQGGRHHTDTAAFLQKAAKEVHGAGGAAGSLADTVGRRKGMSDAGAGFRRH